MRLVLRLTAVLLVLAALPTAAADIAVNVDSQPAGLTIRFDGADAITPFTRMVPAGTSHGLLAVSPQAGEPGTRFLFDHWNGPFGVPLTSAQFNFTPGGSYFDYSYGAVYRVQHTVALSLGPGGSILPGPGTSWRDEDSTLAISARPYPGYSFAAWEGTGDGAYGGTEAVRNVTIHAPITEHATFRLNRITTTVETLPHGLLVRINGVSRRAPFALEQDANRAIALDAPEMQLSVGGMLAFARWSDGGARAHTVSPSVSGTYLVTYAPTKATSAISAAWPNPAHATSQFEIVLPGDLAASVIVHDAHGRIVRRLVNGPMTAGVHPVTWDGRDDHGQPVPSGIYLVRARWEGFADERRLVRLR